MKFLINRDFREYSLQPDWLTLEESDLSKSIWKRFGSKSNYLDENFSNNWRIILVYKNQIISEEEAVNLLKNSVLQYYKDETNFTSFISIIDSISNNNIGKRREKDLIKIYLHNTLLKTMLVVFNKLDIERTEQEIDAFITSNPEFGYTIPLIEEQYILQPFNQKKPWDFNSIQAFLQNNSFIQIKRTILESEGIAIAIFIRKDLKLGKGKSGAQLSHAAITLLFQPTFRNIEIENFMNSVDKSLLLYSVKDLKDLKEIEHLCRLNKINHSLIMDAGHTQIAPGTITTCAVGPIPKIWLRILAYNIEASELI